MAQQAKTNLHGAAFIDSIIQANVPDEHNNLSIQVVPKHNVHCLCGYLNPYADCTIDKYCWKRFCKHFAEENGHIESQRYVAYHGRSPNFCGKKASWTYRFSKEGSVTQNVHDSWIVSYCPKLSVTVQASSTSSIAVFRVGGIKYLFGYVCKSSRRVTIKKDREEQQYVGIGNF